jgi:hypothetical protein
MLLVTWDGYPIPIGRTALVELVLHVAGQLYMIDGIPDLMVYYDDIYSNVDALASNVEAAAYQVGNPLPIGDLCDICRNCILEYTGDLEEVVNE